ncbi:MAG TPA: hypothetical protein VFX74_00690 [Candidatus Limnocylindria bacterium]|nr:hypothetical protein [Candidatus Limnocylindria bacterium]
MRTNLLLRKDLVDEVDRQAGPRGRSRYVTEALEEKLRADRLRRVVRETAGAWRDHPGFPTSDSVTAWVRDRRAEETHDPR